MFLFSAEGLGLVKWELHLIITMGRPLFRDVDFAFNSGWARKRGVSSMEWMDRAGRDTFENMFGRSSLGRLQPGALIMIVAGRLNVPTATTDTQGSGA